MLAACALLPVAALAQDPPTAATGPTVDVREVRYGLDAVTLSEVIERLNSMRLEGPDGPRSQGLTDWHMQPRWRTAASAGTCRVAGLALEVSITITLPDWSRAGSATLDERERWEVIERAIREHEYAHRDLTLEAADELYGSLSGLEARGCMALRRAFEGTLGVAQARLREAHRELDRATPRRLIGASRGG